MAADVYCRGSLFYWLPFCGIRGIILFLCLYNACVARERFILQFFIRGMIYRVYRIFRDFSIANNVIQGAMMIEDIDHDGASELNEDRLNPRELFSLEYYKHKQ